VATRKGDRRFFNTWSQHPISCEEISLIKVKIEQLKSQACFFVGIADKVCYLYRGLCKEGGINKAF